MRFLPILFAALILPAAASAAGIKLTRIADGTTVAADGSNLFYFANPQISGKKVVFASQSQKLLFSLYAAPVTGGSLTNLVSSNTPVPHGTGNFTLYQPSGCNAPVAGLTSAAFVGTDAAKHLGVYSVPLAGGAVVRLADYTTPIPGAPIPPKNDTLFNSSYRPCNIGISGSTVFFDTTGGDGQGVYSVVTNGHSLVRVADSNTPQGGTPPFPIVNGFLQPSISGTSVVYVGGTTGGPYGIYRSGKSTLITPVVSDANSEGSDFDQFSRPAIGGQTVLFAANYKRSAISNVLATVPLAGGTPRIVFNVASTKVPTGAIGDIFGEVGTDTYNFLGNDHHRQIFTATTQDQPPKPYNIYDGVFTVCRGKLAKVLQTGDAVGTQAIRAVHGISALQRVIVGGAALERFAVWLSLGAPTTPPTVYNGAPGIYVVTMSSC